MNATVAKYSNRFTRPAIKDLTCENILSVYSGKPGCCCGCKGTHYANPDHRAEAEKERGYAYDDKHVSQRMTEKVLGIIKAQATEEDYNSSHIAVETDTRLYIVYLR